MKHKTLFMLIVLIAIAVMGASPNIASAIRRERQRMLKGKEVNKHV